MKTALYNYKDSKKIIEYYKDKIIGKNIGNDENPMIIIDLNIKEYGYEKFRIICNFSKIKNGYSPIQIIENVLENFDLPLPNEILKT